MFFKNDALVLKGCYFCENLVVKELKKHFAEFFAKKFIEQANETRKEKGLTNDIMDEWLMKVNP